MPVFDTHCIVGPVVALLLLLVTIMAVVTTVVSVLNGSISAFCRRVVICPSAFFCLLSVVITPEKGFLSQHYEGLRKKGKKVRKCPRLFINKLSIQHSYGMTLPGTLILALSI